MSQPWDYIAKLVCIGDSGTGKSSLTIRLCEGRFTAAHDVTIGVEFGSRIVSVGPRLDSSGSGSAAQQKRMKLSLWDTAGQETYKSITRSYFRGASGALLVFDITRRSTFDAALSWLHDLRQIAEEGIVVVLVGNKSDLADSGASQTLNENRYSMQDERKGLENGSKRTVSVEEAEEWCKQNGVLRYVETSAKSGEGVEHAFLEVAQRIWQNIEAGKYDLNDRRSGVKGPGAGVGGGGRGGQGARTVNLGMADVAGNGSKAGWSGGCC